jgi:hypothetical protein
MASNRMHNVAALRPNPYLRLDRRRDPDSWWMRWPRELLTLAILLASLAFWAMVLPAIGVF